MFALLLVPILVCGYVIASNHSWYKLRLHRLEGQLLYLSCARHGLICVVIGFGLLVIWQSAVPSEITIPARVAPFLPDSWYPALYVDIQGYLAKGLTAWAPEKEETASQVQKDALFVLQKNAANIAWVIVGSIKSLLIAYGWCILDKRLRIRKTAKVGLSSAREKAKEKAKENKTEIAKITKAQKREIKVSAKFEYKIYLHAKLINDDPMLKLFFESYLKGVKLVFGLDNRKVLMGRVISMGEPTESTGMDKEIRIVPFWSGYEDKDTLQIVIERNISWIDSITLRQDKIVYAHYNNDYL